MSYNNFLYLLSDALKNNHIELALASLKTFRPVDIADVLTQLSLDQSQLLLTHLPDRAYVFSYLAPNEQVKLAKVMPRNTLAEIIGEMSSDKRADVFKCLDEDQQNALLPALAQAEREDIRQLASYLEGTAGAIMSSEYATLKPNMRVNDAIKMLRLEAPDTETIYFAYVLDEARKILGVLSLKQLILASEDQNDDAMDVASEEATEDFLKVGAVNASSKLSIKSAPILQLYQKRVFWLVFLVFGSLLSGIGIAHYEDVIAQNLVLVFFLPLLVGSGGNAGSQSSTLMVRALATGDVQFKDWFYLLGRESLVALCLGGTMAIAVSLLGFFRGDEMVALVLALSMMGIVLMGCLIGMSLPFILNKAGLDPASASAPLVTSICDATGVIVYLFIASMILF